MHDVRALFRPHAYQQSFCGETDAQRRVAWYRHACHQGLAVVAQLTAHVILALAGADHMDAIAALEQTLDHARHGDRDTIHLGQISFSDQRDIEWR
jgi:hypothetical protein